MGRAIVFDLCRFENTAKNPFSDFVRGSQGTKVNVL
jgi:hypothetical protein